MVIIVMLFSNVVLHRCCMLNSLVLLAVATVSPWSPRVRWFKLGIGVFSGDQSFSRDQQLDLMGDEWGRIRYPFWGVDSNQVKSGFSQTFPVFFGQFFQFILGFSVFWMIWMKPGIFNPSEYQKTLAS